MNSPVISRVFFRLMLPLLALSSAELLSAQTLIVDKPSVVLNAPVGGSPVSQTITIRSNDGSAQNFTLSYPSYSWLKVNGQPFGAIGTTPATVTVTADPTGLPAQTLSGNIVIQSSATISNPNIAVTFTISAIGVSPQSVSMSYTVGSTTFPSSQVLTISGASTACTATAATSTGGNWFNLLSGTCNSPGILSVVPNTGVIQGLAAGTYNGTITIAPTPAGQSPAAVVPLTLTVAPTPPVTVNPSSLNLNFQTGVGAANPSATFTIATTSPQPIAYSITQTGSLASISTISPSASGATDLTSGTAQLTYSVNTAGLAAGTYTSKLTVNTPSGSPTSQDVNITLVVSPNPLLNVPNATLNFTYQVGASVPAQQNVNITATSGTLTYAVNTPNAAWLTVPNSGVTPTPLPVSLNPAGLANLATGTYNATITVTPANSSIAQQIPVVLKVTNEPAISTSVSKLSFPYQIGQLAPASQSFKVSSSTGAALNYSATVATTTCGNNWLLLNGATNTITGATDGTLTVSVSTVGLVAGTCDGAVTITATNPATGAVAVNSPLTIPVKLYVSSTALLVVAPTAPPVFTVGVGTTSATQQTITLTSTNTDVLTYTTAFQSDKGWLFVQPQSGSTTQNNVLTLTVIASGLAAGTYNGTVTVTASGPNGATVNNSPVTIPVTLNVTSGSLTLSATDLSFEQNLGGSAPAAQNVTIGSTGPALNYTAAANSNNSVNWLTVSPSSGNTSSSGVLAISVDGSKLTPGVTYTGSINVSAPGAANSPATINVKFKLNSGTISAPTTTLTFTQAAGGAAPAAQTIAVTGSPAPLNFTVTKTMTNGTNWLNPTTATGTTPGTVQVQVDGSALAIGQYTGKVTISAIGATGSPIDVPVVLNVVAPATLSSSPASLTFSSISGQTAAPAQSILISAANATGSVPFTVQAQADGSVGQWLVVNPTSGTAPASLQVSVSSATPVGTYNGRIVVNSSNALTPLTIPVTLTVTAISKPVFTSVANAANYFKDSVAPGENVVIFGTGIGPATLVQGTVSGNAFPTTLGNTRVLFDNTPAPIIYASSGQTSVMVPYGVQGRPTTSVVVEYFGVKSDPLTYNVAAAAPGIYTLNTQGTGPGAILNQDGLTVNGPTAPEKRGNVIAIYMTGEGQTDPQGSDGAVIPAVVSALKKPLLPVTVTIGGVDAQVVYAGSAPGLISGVMQVNAIIPLTAPVGTQPVVVTVGTFKSQSGASAATVAVSQ